jgi:membrane protease YdiL (CAAX protease family)
MEALLPLIAEWVGVLGVVWLAGISPAFKYPPVGFKYPRREGLVALGLLALIFVFCLIQSAGWLRPVLTSDTPALQPVLLRLNIAVLSLLPFIVALLSRRQPLRSVVGARVMLGANVRLGLALAFLSIFLRGKFTSVMDGLTPDEYTMFIVSAGICLAEEFIFRGYIQLRMRSWLGETRGWIATALLFVLWQLPFWAASGDQLLLNLGLTVCQALILAVVAQRSKYILAPVFYRVISEWLFFVS